MPRGRRGRGRRGAAEPAEQARNVPTNTTQGEDQAYDGPSDARGRSPSNAGPSQTVRTASRRRSSSRQPAASQQTQRRDPARDPPKEADRVLLKNFDFGGGAYNFLDDGMPVDLMKRPAFGKLGKPALLNINSYLVTQFPDKTVYQYDVTIGSGEEKPGLVKATVESKAFKTAVGPGFLFDGKKLAWSMANHAQELRFHVDLDAERGRPVNPDRENKVRVKVVKATKINLEVLNKYLRNEYKFDNIVLQCIDFMDHLLRETPKSKHINLRRSYFSRKPAPDDIYSVGLGIQAIKGVYQSLRTAEGQKLVVNVDVSNSCFWQQTTFTQLAYFMSGETDRLRFLGISQLKDGKEPPLWQTLKRLSKNKFYVKYPGQANGADTKIWTVNRISSYHAKSYTFDVRNRETGQTVSTSLFDYYWNKYHVRVDNWHLPLVETQKKGTLFPMDICYMCPGQRYPYKLGDTQTTAMIKFAVSRPPQRRSAIEKGLGMLDWANDPYLRNYGLKISPNMIETKARVLDPPEVQYKGSTARPMYSGRWDLRGKVFFKPNEAPLVSWGVVVLVTHDRKVMVSKDQLTAFLKNFINLYQTHGGIVTNKTPAIIQGVPDAAKAIETCYSAAGNQAQLRPQMMLIILPNKNADVYHRVKKNMDCRWGIVSQCVQAAHVQKNQPQYCSNVLMKFNCKLGGTTCTIKAAKPFFTVPNTLIIGADVTHAAPGSVQASIAALTVSMDLTASRFAAGVQTNGYRVEMIQTKVLEETLGPLIQHWMNTVSNGRLPQHVYYFRDGVSERQYVPLLQREVADMKRIFEQIAESAEKVPKFTVVVCEKRHHIRFFPKGGVAADKNANPVPGVVVDHDITHPTENDIYLNSHSAIQGTARPTHYQMLIDEMNVPVDDFQKMLYQFCYQYQRATTPVSLFPACYYAHLAAARAIAHINISEMDRWKIAKEKKMRGGEEDSSEKDSLAEAPPLIPMDNKNRIRYAMWYI